MAEVSSSITYTVRLTEREYKLVAKGLALLAGVEGPRAVPEDRAAASDLNQRLLDQQAADLREKLKVADHKRVTSVEQTQPGDSIGNRADAAMARLTGRTR
jgi:hypothetical protein